MTYSALRDMQYLDTGFGDSIARYFCIGIVLSLLKNTEITINILCFPVHLIYSILIKLAAELANIIK